MFSIFERDNETTGIDFVKAIAAFVISTIASIAYGFIAYFETFNRTTLFLIGGVAGYFFGFLLCILVIATSISRSLFLLRFIFITSIAFGIYVMFGYKKKLEPLASTSIGAYMIIRGLSFIFGGYPSTTATLPQISGGC
jgi:hypothetical protein